VLFFATEQMRKSLGNIKEKRHFGQVFDITIIPQTLSNVKRNAKKNAVPVKKFSKISIFIDEKIYSVDR
jgi:hypothetical protein